MRESKKPGQDRKFGYLPIILGVTGFVLLFFSVFISPDLAGGDKVSTQPVLISADPQFNSINPINVSGPNISTVETNWVVDNRSFGEWRQVGLGGRPPPEILLESNTSGYYLHPWVMNPQVKSEWLDSNISQYVTIPESVEKPMAILKARSGAHNLINSSTDKYPACVPTLMELSVRTKEEVLSDEEYVEKKPEIISLDLTRFRGEEVKLIGGVESDAEKCGKSHKWLEIMSLKVMAEAPTSLATGNNLIHDFN